MVDQLPRLSEEEFDHIEETIARTAKGRSFLRLFRRRAFGASTEEVRAMLEEFRVSWRQQGDGNNRAGVLRREIIEMGASIERARQEIAALRPPDDKNDKILSATNELDAIVTSTERASFEILNSAERLLDLAGRLRAAGAEADICADIDSEVSAIFTACSFQDLTGQRTSKVIFALRFIEERINSILRIWEHDGDALMAEIREPVDTREDAHLLNGPQLEGLGVSQDDVDSMFDSPPPARPPAKPVETQASIDDMFSAAVVPPPPPEVKGGGAPQSQADIDSLFDSPTPARAPTPVAAKPAPAKAAPPPPPPPPAPAAKSGGGPQSQADIDNLFDAPTPPAKAKPPAPAPAPAPAKAKPPPPPPSPAPPRPAPTKPKPAEPAPAAKTPALDQSAIDALFG
ncbi:chemotaxis protein CheZ [uncultured Gammaproteobacteria bacterium]